MPDESVALAASVSADPIPKHHYRPDIDGLRAIAVLSVVLFHAHFSLPGGFVGVDIFFVISGYLITKIIDRELREGRFSVMRFYQRRIKRIFPALFAMFAVSIAIAYVALPPIELKELGKALLSSSAFSSNILFYGQSGYFATRAEYQPLLHTWSLSVEEQFYVFWPLLLALFSIPVLSKWKMTGALLILVSTLALSAYWVNNNPNAAFYLLPSRAWELTLGAALCFPLVSRFLINLPRNVASVISVSGIVILIATVCAYDELTPFPGFAAILPCVGAALIIGAGEGGESIGGRILSWRPLVWVGLISYSLYLWHWPVLVFSRLILNRELSVSERGGLLLLTVIVAWLSWRLVETPFRNPQFVRCSDRAWVLAGLATTVSFVGVGAVLVTSEGLPKRQAGLIEWEKKMREEGVTFQSSPCLARGASVPAPAGCLLGASSRGSEYEGLLWGDSHAAHLAPAFHEVGNRLGTRFREITKAGCPPVPGVQFLPMTVMRKACPAFNESAVQTILADKNIRAVALAARWEGMARGHVLLSADGYRPAFEDSRGLFVMMLRKVLATFRDAGLRVILIGQVPLPPSDPIACMARARFNHQDEGVCSITQSTHAAETEMLVNQALREASAGLQPEVEILYPYGHLCREEGCLSRADGRLLYMDDTHLSSSGAQFLVNALEKSVASALGAKKDASVAGN